MRYLIGILLTFVILSSCENVSKSVKVTNTLDIERKNALVVLDFARLFPNLSVAKTTRVSVLNNGNPIPTQWSFDHRLIVLLSFKPHETKTLTIHLNSNPAAKTTQRAHAEISIRKKATFTGKKWVGGHFVSVLKCTVDKKHFIHDALIRYEGPGLESDKIAYRIYLDKRNAMDVFGKKTSKIILPIVGQDISTTYHQMNTWGMDILKVGQTFGVGSFTLYISNKSDQKDPKPTDFKTTCQVDSMICSILEDGPLRAGYQVLYKGWQVGNQKVDVLARHFIRAGSYLINHQIEMLNGKDVGLAFGVMHPKKTDLNIFSGDGEWENITVIPSLAGDSLTAMLYFNQHLKGAVGTEMKGNRVYFVPSSIKKVRFWSGALWQSNFKAKSFSKVCAEFAREHARRLAHPIQVEYYQNGKRQ